MLKVGLKNLNKNREILIEVPFQSLVESSTGMVGSSSVLAITWQAWRWETESIDPWLPIYLGIDGYP